MRREQGIRGLVDGGRKCQIKNQVSVRGAFGLKGLKKYFHVLENEENIVCKLLFRGFVLMTI